MNERWTPGLVMRTQHELRCDWGGTKGLTYRNRITENILFFIRFRTRPPADPSNSSKALTHRWSLNYHTLLLLNPQDSNKGRSRTELLWQWTASPSGPMFVFCSKRYQRFFVHLWCQIKRHSALMSQVMKKRLVQWFFTWVSDIEQKTHRHKCCD